MCVTSRSDRKPQVLRGQKNTGLDYGLSPLIEDVSISNCGLERGGHSMAD